MGKCDMCLISPCSDRPSDCDPDLITTEDIRSGFESMVFKKELTMDKSIFSVCRLKRNRKNIIVSNLFIQRVLQNKILVNKRSKIVIRTCEKEFIGENHIDVKLSFEVTGRSHDFDVIKPKVIDSLAGITVDNFTFSKSKKVGKSTVKLNLTKRKADITAASLQKVFADVKKYMERKIYEMEVLLKDRG